MTTENDGRTHRRNSPSEWRYGRDLVKKQESENSEKNFELASSSPQCDGKPLDYVLVIVIAVRILVAASNVDTAKALDGSGFFIDLHSHTSGRLK